MKKSKMIEDYFFNLCEHYYDAVMKSIVLHYNTPANNRNITEMAIFQATIDLQATFKALTEVCNNKNKKVFDVINLKKIREIYPFFLDYMDDVFTGGLAPNLKLIEITKENISEHWL